MGGRDAVVDSLRLLSAGLLILAVLPGCDGQLPGSPSRDSLIVSGYVYQAMRPGSGEPPLADVLIVLRDAAGTESTAVSDQRGFYMLRAAPGVVVVSAAKEGYDTEKSQFDISASTVLNFSLKAIPP
jgi:hypothetical protein